MVPCFKPEGFPGRARAGGRGAAALLLTALAACGGRSGSPRSVPAMAFAGAWAGQDGSGQPIYALVLPDGTTRWLAGTTMTAGMLTQQGGTLEGSVYQFTAGPPSAGSSGPRKLAAQGEAAGALLLLALADDAGDLTPYAFLPDAAANGAVLPAALAGSYTAATTTAGVAASITLSATGALTGTSHDGTLAGTFAPVFPGATGANVPNAFTVSFTYTSTAGGEAALTGLACYRPGTAPQIILMADNGTVQYSGVFTQAATGAAPFAASTIQRCSRPAKSSRPRWPITA